MTLRRFIVTLGGLVLCYVSAAGQAIDVDLVNLDVIVTDRSGDNVVGLTKNQFKVFDDGVEQKVTNFSTGEEPITAVILMQRNPIQAASGFINILRPEDRAALVTYDAHPEIL